MQQKACEIGPQTEPRLTVRVSAASPNRRSDHGSVLFSARTLLFLVDPEKSSLGATVPQRRIVAQIRWTNHNRRPYTRTTGADSSGSFSRRTCQTLNASKSVRIWTPNRAEVDRCVSRPRARAAVRTTGAYFSRLVPCCSLWTPKSRVWALRYRNAGLSRKYDGPIRIVGHTHALPALIVPVRCYEEPVKR